MRISVSTSTISSCFVAIAVAGHTGAAAAAARRRHFVARAISCHCQPRSMYPLGLIVKRMKPAASTPSSWLLVRRPYHYFDQLQTRQWNQEVSVVARHLFLFAYDDGDNNSNNYAVVRVPNIDTLSGLRSQ